MRKVVCRTRTQAKRLLSLVFVVWLVCTTAILPCANAAPTEISLKYTLTDGTTIHMTAPFLSFPNSTSEELFLQVEEQMSEVGNVAESLSALEYNIDTIDTRTFDIRVMQN
ncbi:MAG: hypothetical protein RSD97_09110, partial [Lachnospiraceae bacterium]